VRVISGKQVSLAIAGGVVVALGLALWSISSRPGPRFADPPNDFTLASLHRFGSYPVYGVGRRIDGLGLSGISWQRPGEGSSGFVAMLYGGCRLSGGSEPRCTYPLEIQSWRACTRDEGTDNPPSVTSQRGARVGRFSGRELHVYTGRSTVVVDAPSPRLANDVVRLLRAQNVLAARAMRGDRLAPPTQIPRACS
jgi:hypothetical protein